jgi:hypothetical protein
MASQLLGGFLGAPPQRYDRQFLEEMGGGNAEIDAFLHGLFRLQPNKKVALAIPHTCTDDEMLVHCTVTKLIIDRYRATAKPVPKFWRTADTLLVETLLMEGSDCEFKGLTFENHGVPRIFLPNGMAISYEGLAHQDDGSYRYGVNGRTRTLYGSKIVENCVQAVARIVCSDAMLRVQKRYRVVHCAHDELVALVPQEEAEEALAWVLAQMTQEPRFLPGIPLAADGGFDVSYGRAKQ